MCQRKNESCVCVSERESAHVCVCAHGCACVLCDEALSAVIVLFRGATSNQSSDDPRVELCLNYDPVRKIQRKEMIKNKQRTMDQKGN